MKEESFVMINRVLITGGAGFIGSKIADKLYQKGYTITIFDNLSEQIHGKDAEFSENLKKIATCIKGDVRNKVQIVRALENQDAVIHLAAETGTGQSMYEIERYTDVNIKGTSIILDFLSNNNHHIKKIIVASSRAIYGEGKYICKSHGDVYPNERKDDDLVKADFECKCPECNSNLTLVKTDENSKIHPSSIYGITKQNQEQMVLTVGKSLNIPAVAFRYQNVYGPGQSLSNPYTGILSIFSTRIKNENDLNIFEDGMESRDFIYIDDVVDATILGLEKKEADYEVFNVGSGEATTVLNVAETLKKLYKSTTNIHISGNYRLGDIRHNIADLTKIQNKLGYTPKIMFDEGIKRFVGWVEQQDIMEDNYEKSIKEMKERGLYK
jgi:dTDP-L-rhamnose 4-epimerase